MSDPSQPFDTNLERVSSLQSEMEILSPLEAIALSEKPYLQRWSEYIGWEMKAHFKEDVRHSALGALLVGLLAWLDGSAAFKDIYYPLIGFVAVFAFKTIFAAASAPSEIDKIIRQRERLARLLLAEEKNKNLLPDLSDSAFDYLMIGQMTDNDRYLGATITVAYIMRNTGAPSNVSDWALYIEFPGQPKVLGVPVMFEDTLRLGMVEGQPHILRSVDRLDNKLAQTQLPQWGRVPGFLLYIFPNYSREAIDQPTNTIHLEYSDGAGRRYTARKSLSEATSPMPLGHSPYVPGLVFQPESPKPPEPPKPPRKQRSQRARHR